MNESLQTLLALYSPAVQEICLALRSVTREAMPQAIEIIYHAALNYSVSQSVSERLCYIAPQPTYVNVGFFFGADLPDPEHLLQGQGKRLRHTKVKRLQDAQNPALAQMIHSAWETRAKSLAQLRQNKNV